MIDQIFDDFKIDVRFQQRQANFAQGFTNVLLGQPALAAEVFEGSPAARAGVEVSDVISHINNESVSGLTLQQVTEKVRGSENTKVVLKVLRKGQNDPIEFSITREILKLKSVEGAPK